MKNFKFTKESSIVAVALFAIYFIYGMFYTPIVEYLTCIAIGGIAYGITESAEISVLAVLISNLLFPMFRKNRIHSTVYTRSEGFADAKDPEEVTKRIDSMTHVKGVGSPFVESFADASEITSRIKTMQGEGFADMESPTQTQASTMDTPPPATKISADGVPPATLPADLATPKEEKKETEEFEDNGLLFKLGKIPKDVKGGFHIDSGTTILNALKALKPDQVKAMTQDTKQLIETQKNLMEMLNSFKPLMSEGKQMMDTFQEMFAPTGAAANSLTTGVNHLSAK